MPPAYTSVTTVRDPHIIRTLIHHLSVSELVVAAEEVGTPTERFQGYLTGLE